MYCHKCGEQIEMDHKIAREEMCPKCKSYLHCCLNCKFYDKFSFHECKETETEYVQDKTGANYCDYWKASDVYRPPNQKADEARAKLEAMFKKKEA